MPRKQLLRTSEFPYHITNRSNNREFFYVDQPALWANFLDRFQKLSSEFNCRILGFVLMSNHYHLLIQTPELNIGEAMKYLHREVARNANRDSGRMNHFFGGRYKWSVIHDEAYYWNAVKYVFRNPVRAGLCEKVENYAFSSLNRPADFNWRMADFLSKTGPRIELDTIWLNEPFLTEHEQAVQMALRRRVFEPPKNTGRWKIDLPPKPRIS